jgi:hypothetical protein
MASKWPEEADEFKSTKKYYQLLQYWSRSKSKPLKISRSGYQAIRRAKGWLTNELQGIKITSMSMQSFSKIWKGLCRNVKQSLGFLLQFCFDLMKTVASDLSKYQIGSMFNMLKAPFIRPTGVFFHLEWKQETKFERLMVENAKYGIKRPADEFKSTKKYY